LGKSGEVAYQLELPP
jgi:hypothetical protein